MAALITIRYILEDLGTSRKVLIEGCAIQIRVHFPDKGDHQMAVTPKRLYRSREDKMLAGVCGGLGEYLNVDPTLIRLITVLLTIWLPFLLFAYLILVVVVPWKPEGKSGNPSEPQPPSEDVN